MIEMHGHAVLFRGLLQHAQAFGHHFLADAVTGNDRDPVLFLWTVPREIPCASFGPEQWTKVEPGATLQCNVDRLRGGSLTAKLRPPRQTSPTKREIPWICICAASAS